MSLGAASRDGIQRQRIRPASFEPNTRRTRDGNLAGRRESPDKYLRGDSDDNNPRDALAEYRERAAAAGQEVPESPLSDVADLCIRGIRDDLFWATYPLEGQMQKLDERYASMKNLTSPDYLAEVNLMSADADERSKQ